ncbi:hypothetical protein [Aliidongia sp.]|uniref:hypothetical protein n=1 Tax=Aliidongia sp. TaxID=1914230 RepID=UPI002DDD03E1|nr:hypothetical protein [Aliidongia sp.]
MTILMRAKYVSIFMRLHPLPASSHREVIGWPNEFLMNIFVRDEPRRRWTCGIFEASSRFAAARAPGRREKIVRNNW